MRPLILEDETNTKSQNTAQQTPSDRKQYARIMEFSVANNVKEHFCGLQFFFYHKTVTLTLSEPVTRITDVLGSET